MAVSVARDTIVCPGCGKQRIVSNRQVRFSRQQGGIRCATCRGRSPHSKMDETHFRFWLRRFGVDPPQGVTAREFITAGGAPPELIELARQAYPDVL